mgnify:CR=1 FL=1
MFELQKAKVKLLEFDRGNLGGKLFSGIRHPASGIRQSMD